MLAYIRVEFLIVYGYVSHTRMIMHFSCVPLAVAFPSLRKPAATISSTGLCEIQVSYRPKNLTCKRSRRLNNTTLTQLTSAINPATFTLSTALSSPRCESDLSC
jgi:hypothetical protein